MLIFHICVLLSHSLTSTPRENYVFFWVVDTGAWKVWKWKFLNFNNIHVFFIIYSRCNLWWNRCGKGFLSKNFQWWLWSQEKTFWMLGVGADKKWFWELRMRLTESVYILALAKNWRTRTGGWTCAFPPSNWFSCWKSKIKADSRRGNFHQRKLEKLIKPQISAPEQWNRRLR